MIPRNGATGARPTSIRPSIKKKPPPPRPPQPKINRLQSSLSFNTAQDLTSAQNHGIATRPAGKDLIDFSTPPGSPSSGRRNTVSNISVAKKDPNDWCYRVGASIFYIKSPLKNSVPDAPVQNPFSPPRPSNPSGTTNINSAWSPVHTTSSTQKSPWESVPPPTTNQAASTYTSKAPVSDAVQNAPFQNTSSLDNNNTIKSNYQQSAWIPAGVSSSSNASSNRSSASLSDAGGYGKPRYGNVPAAVHKELSTTLSSGSGTGSGLKPKAPTIIRPATKLTSQISKEPVASSNSVNNIVSSFENSVTGDQPTGNGSNGSEPVQRNYYDVPPDEDDFDDEDDDPTDSSFMSPPMPSEPAPVLHLENAASMDYPDTCSDTGQTAYALALYDLQPQVEGDIPLQTGDLVYLLRRIDDNWYYGSCGGVEGMVPSNFLNVMVPLEDIEEETQIQTEPETEVGVYTVAEFEFPAETDSDLSLKVGDMIKVLGRINEDWLYGEIDGSKGQFPAAFVQPILQDLPVITI